MSAPPSPENRQRAIKILAAQMIKGGASPQDAADTATLIIDAAIDQWGGSSNGETGEAGSDTGPG